MNVFWKKMSRLYLCGWQRYNGWSIISPIPKVNDIKKIMSNVVHETDSNLPLTLPYSCSLLDPPCIIRTYVDPVTDSDPPLVLILQLFFTWSILPYRTVRSFWNRIGSATGITLQLFVTWSTLPYATVQCPWIRLGFVTTCYCITLPFFVHWSAARVHCRSSWNGRFVTCVHCLRP